VVCYITFGLCEMVDESSTLHDVFLGQSLHVLLDVDFREKKKKTNESFWTQPLGRFAKCSQCKNSDCCLLSSVL